METQCRHDIDTQGQILCPRLVSGMRKARCTIKASFFLWVLNSLLVGCEDGVIGPRFFLAQPIKKDLWWFKLTVHRESLRGCQGNPIHWHQSFKAQESGVFNSAAYACRHSEAFARITKQKLASVWLTGFVCNFPPPGRKEVYKDCASEGPEQLPAFDSRNWWTAEKKTW